MMAAAARRPDRHAVVRLHALWGEYWKASGLTNRGLVGHVSFGMSHSPGGEAKFVSACMGFYLITATLSRV
jgi:hypothetical protein